GRAADEPRPRDADARSDGEENEVEDDGGDVAEDPGAPTVVVSEVGERVPDAERREVPSPRPLRLAPRERVADDAREVQRERGEREGGGGDRGGGEPATDGRQF